ncbi:MAG: NAD-dependent epimerase/dehydratase family protein [Candidatus Eremiobacteraeota bacterium]|nr:NAD-dependent epimerase/dehydratase family protein [Candidatus Eremiobacteraeota bacterium]
MRSVLITGGAGFIGRALVDRFTERHWRAIAAGRHRPPDLPSAAEWRAYDLASPQVPSDLFAGVDALVHAAYAKEDFDVNVDGSSVLLEAARRAGVKQIVFLSSLAAHAHARSRYGKQKYVLEKLFDARGALVVRPGLVLGDGGIFAAMCGYLRHHRFVPLIDGGAQPLQTVHIDDLTDAIVDATDEGRIGTYTVAEREPISYRQFYRNLGARLGAGVTFVPVPFPLADAAVRAASVLRIRLPIDRDNLLGLAAMHVDRGPRLQPTGRSIGDFRSNIERAVEVGRRHRSG